MQEIYYIQENQIVQKENICELNCGYYIKNVTVPIGWPHLERELETEEGAVFNSILMIPDSEENFIIPDSKNSFKIDLSDGYNDYCVWLVLYTLFDTNDPNTQKVIKNDSITVQNPLCSL